MASGKKIRQLYVVVDAEISGYEKGMMAVSKGIDKSTKEWKSKFGAFANVSNGIANGLLGFAAAGTAGILKMGELAGQMDKVRATYEQFLGSQEAAGAFIEKLHKFGDLTPFTDEQIQGVAGMLLAFKFAEGEIVPMMTAIGDASRGDADKFNNIAQALGKIKFSGKLTLGLRPLIAEGVDAWRYLADASGKSIKEVQAAATKGTINTAEAIRVILAGMERDFGGMAERQANKLPAKFKTLRDHLERMGEDQGKGYAPALGLLVDDATKMVDVLGRLNPKLLLWAVGLAGVAGITIKLVNWSVQLRYQLGGLAMAQMLQGGAASGAAKANMEMAGSTWALAKGAAAASWALAKMMVWALAIPALIASLRDLGSIITHPDKWVGEGDSTLKRMEDAYKKNSWMYKMINGLFGGGSLGGALGVDTSGMGDIQKMMDAMNQAAEDNPLISDSPENLAKSKAAIGQQQAQEWQRLHQEYLSKKEMQDNLIADYNTATDAAEKSRLAGEINRNQLAFEQERYNLGLMTTQYNEVNAATSAAAIEAINNKYEIEKARVAEQQKSELEIYDYRQQKEEKQHQLEMELDKQRYEARKRQLLEIANSYAFANRDYIKGVEDGLNRIRKIITGDTEKIVNSINASEIKPINNKVPDFNEKLGMTFEEYLKKFNVHDLDHPDSHYDYRAAYRASYKPTKWTDLPKADRDEDLEMIRTGKRHPFDTKTSYMWTDDFKLEGHEVPPKIKAIDKAISTVEGRVRRWYELPLPPFIGPVTMTGTQTEALAAARMAPLVAAKGIWSPAQGHLPAPVAGMVISHYVTVDPSKLFDVHVESTIDQVRRREAGMMAGGG